MFPDSATLHVEQASVHYPSSDESQVEALKDINLSVRGGEFISLIGPSGCGKTTLIKLLAGLIMPSRGSVRENGVPLAGPSRDRGVVFQQYGLFPWLSVAGNIGLGLSIQGVSRSVQKRVIGHYVEVMGLQGFEQSYPRELSGGMSQRVALARTLATNPKILLMDEPFAALDVQTKRFMQDLLLQIWGQEPRTVIFVTHDVEEAVFLSDTVYIMTARPGSIREKIAIDVPRPRDLATEFSEKFIAIKKHVQEVITRESLGNVALNLNIYKNL